MGDSFTQTEQTWQHILGIHISNHSSHCTTFCNSIPPRDQTFGERRRNAKANIEAIQFQIFAPSPRWLQARTCPPLSWCWWATEALVGLAWIKILTTYWLKSFKRCTSTWQCDIPESCWVWSWTLSIKIPLRKDHLCQETFDWRVWEEVCGHPWSGGISWLNC